MDSVKNEKPRVLIIEDDPINMLIATEILRADTTLFMALTPDVALELTSMSTFDVIIVDLNLGHHVCSGIQLVKQIKDNNKTQDTIYIGVSSLIMPEDKKPILQEGFDYFFEKPYEKQTLLQAIFKHTTIFE